MITSLNSKEGRSILQGNPMLYVAIVAYSTFLDPSIGLQGRFLPVFGTAIYDSNSLAVAKGLDPINLTSIILGKLMAY